MELVYTNSSHEPQGIIRDFTLDMAIGEDENDFELSVAAIPKVAYSYRPVEDEAEGYEVEVMPEVGGKLSAFGINGSAERKVSRNLISGTDDFSGDDWLQRGNWTNGGTYNGLKVLKRQYAWSGMNKSLAVKAGNTYTFSAFVKVDDASMGVYFYNANTGSTASPYNITSSLGTPTDNGSVNLKGQLGTDWFRFWETFTAGGDGYVNPRFEVSSVVSGKYLYVCGYQLELGSTATDYEPYYPPRVDVVKGRNLLEALEPRIDLGVNWRHVYVGKGEQVTLSTTSSYWSGTANIALVSGKLDNGGVGWTTANNGARVGQPRTITADDSGYVTVVWRYQNGNETDASKPWLHDNQLERGSVATPYVPYGQLGVGLVGKNLLPRSNASNKFVNNTGGTSSSASGLFAWDVVKVQPSAEYVYSYDGINGTGAYIRVAQFKADGTFIKRATKATGASGSWSFTTDEEAAYIIDNTDVSGNATGYAEYLQLELGSTATDYEPYVEGRYGIDLAGNVLASLPNGVMDVLRKDTERTYIEKRVGVVDLGSLSWTYDSTPKRFYAIETGSYMPKLDANDLPNALSPLYSGAAFVNFYNQSSGDLTFAISSAGVISVRNLAYTDETAFRTAMSGVLLYYELAEPYEVELQDVEMPEYFKGYTRMYVDAAVRAYMRARYVFRLSVETLKEVARFDAGSYVYEYGTDRGGVIDTIEYDGTGKVPLFKYSGRTWSGVMENSVTRPDAGVSHIILNGDLNSCISTLISRAGLVSVFSVSEVPCGVSAENYQLPRYVNLYEALTRLCRDHGMRLRIAKGRDIATVDAVRRGEWLDGSMSDLTVSMRLKSTERPCNHLVLLGEGELAQRLVRDVYADEYGNVSTSQRLFGIDEVAEVYETSNEGDPAKLVEDGLKKLSEMQGEYDLAMTLPDGAGYEIGDIVQGVAVEAGFKATAEVVKQVIEVDDDGVCKVGYKVGTPTLAPLM